ncbi:MAG: DUF1028 domain-containing protein, partial [Ignavibacteriae bacterium]|nr:DUF1028 domain-containing protein [Ignavibacteriota bacterium]
KRLTFILFTLLSINISAQTFFGSEPFAHTYSIVARDTVTGEMGVAVQSHWFSVGTLVSWAEAGVGVVATQSFINPSFGLRGLELLKSGLSPQQVIDSLIASDEGRDVRQLAILDVQGRAAAYTGKNCIQDAGHIVGENFSVQANLMKTNKVWPAMASAFENSKGRLAERLLTTMEAAQEQGGDIRGKQSAAILVVKGESTGKVWADRLVDLRVDDSNEPLKEIGRLLKVHRAYEHMNNGDLAIEHGNMELAMNEYSAAEEMFPQNEEMKFWHAVTLANIGNIRESLPYFKEVFSKNADWLILVPRLVNAKLLNVDEKSLKTILKIIK